GLGGDFPRSRGLYLPEDRDGLALRNRVKLLPKRHMRCCSTLRAACPTARSMPSCVSLALRFERQAGRQPRELLAHCFETFHQGPGLVEPALSRILFEVRRSVAGRRGEREQQRAELVSGLTQPRRVLSPQGLAHFGKPDWQIVFEGPAHP